MVSTHTIINMGPEQDIRSSVSEIGDNEIIKQNSEINCEHSCHKNTENIEPTNKELLGSVTIQNCPGVRTSARVIQKMKQDSVRCPSPPLLHDRKDYSKEDRNLQRTPNQSKPAKNWTNFEKNLFFDALNECGKDFDAMYNFINAKLKKNSSDQKSLKTKEQIRHSYYQTFHKLSKYIKFSDEVKKPVQELYALINYGEMIRKLTFVSEKNLMKIKELVYKGHVTVRNKGKSIRIKTPSCKALRKLNQLEGWLEDIKLPSKVEVCLRPKNMEAWGRVQNIAQNPVVRTVVPLQKKLINIIKTFQYRWRNQETKMTEMALKLFGSANENCKCDKIMIENEHEQNLDEPLICLAPQKDIIIHRPLVSITQYLSSCNICLNSYEERMGVKIHGESLWQERSHKRQRSDSGCEKRSPDNKKFKNDMDKLLDITPEKDDKYYKDETEEDLCDDIAELLYDDNKFERNSSSDCMDIYKNDLFSSNEQPSNYDSVNSAKICSDNKAKKVGKRKEKDLKKDINNLRPFINNEIVRKIRQGWTYLNAADITVGDLYVVFGQDSKLMFEYYWLNDNKPKFDLNQLSSVPYSVNETGLQQNDFDKFQHNYLSNKLKHLLLIASLSERIKKKPCSCGHTCGAKTKVENDVSAKSFVSNVTCSGSHADVNVFRQPVTPFRRTLAVQSFKQVPNGHRVKQSRFLRTGKSGSRQIVVQRLLPVQPGINQSYDVVTPQLEIRTVQKQTDGTSQSSLTDSTIILDKENSSTNENSINIDIQQGTFSDITEGDVDLIENTLMSNCQVVENGTIPDRNENKLSKNSLEVIKCVNELNNSTSEILDLNLNPLLELSLPSPLPMPMNSLDDNINDTLTSIIPMSPMQLLRENSGDSKWLEENIGDFSLTSFLGHLDEISNRESSMDNANISIISESSVDYVSKFAEIASLQNEERDL